MPTIGKYISKTEAKAYIQMTKKQILQKKLADMKEDQKKRQLEIEEVEKQLEQEEADEPYIGRTLTNLMLEESHDLDEEGKNEVELVKKSFNVKKDSDEIPEVDEED